MELEPPYARSGLSHTLQGAGGIGGLLARVDHSTTVPALATAFYHADGSGNITVLVNSNQVVVAKYAYDPYGSVIAKTGPLADANVYRFSSKEFQTASGLYYYGYRFYSPGLQRWLNRDPLAEEGGLNLYEFVGNAPQMYVDPLGLSWAGAAAKRCQSMRLLVSGLTYAGGM